MNIVTEIKEKVQTLNNEQFEEFLSWFSNYEEQYWDGQIKEDQKSGPLKDLMEKAWEDFGKGKCNRL